MPPTQKCFIQSTADCAFASSTHSNPTKRRFPLADIFAFYFFIFGVGVCMDSDRRLCALDWSVVLVTRFGMGVNGPWSHLPYLALTTPHHQINSKVFILLEKPPISSAIHSFHHPIQKNAICAAICLISIITSLVFGATQKWFQ